MANSFELVRPFGYAVDILVQPPRLYQNGLEGSCLVRFVPLRPQAPPYHPHCRMKIISSISNGFCDASIFTWDVFLTLGNIVRSSRPVGKVTPRGHPGYAGHWPEYRPPQEGDSRCCCPALNAMANHGMSALCDDRRAIRLTIQRVFFFGRHALRNLSTQWTRHQVHRHSQISSFDVQL